LNFVASNFLNDFFNFRFNANYGALGWIDQLLGTDASFKNTINDKRHITLLSNISARETYPDDDSK
jgi:hypothetical protein